MFDGENCIRCGKRFKFEELKPRASGFGVCEACEVKIRPDAESRRRCPVDNQEMVKRIVAEVVVLDKCTACGGVWFDGGELQIVNRLIKEQAFTKALWAASFMW
jgi:hypothetical protein